MGIFRHFPYSNFHEMNMDEILKILKTLQEEWNETKEEWASYKDFIDNYFANLDVSEEVLQAIRTLANTGELNRLIDPTIANETSTWLSAHITQPTTPVIDNSLTVSGAGADAKVTGDDIRALQNNKVVLVSGGINSEGGNITTTTRIRTDVFIKLEDYLYIKVPTGYSIIAHVYDENQTYLGSMPGFVARYVSSRIVRQFPTGKYARFVIRNDSAQSSDISSEIPFVYTNTLWYKGHPGAFNLLSGSPLASGTDLNDITDFGNYYAASGSIASSLLNSPTNQSFTMKVSFGTGDDASYLIQTITTFRGGEFFRYKAGSASWSAWRNKNSSAPVMSYDDRLLLKNLANDYYNIRNNFVYDGVATRNDYYNTSSAVVDGKFKLDCSTFIQLVYMGRSARDYDDVLNYSNEITKNFNWGYYFDFELHSLAELQPDSENYYGFHNPLESEDWFGSYSYNSYYSKNSTAPKKQIFNSFMFANDMAREMERKGYAIDFSELQTGDIVFTKVPIQSTANTFGDIAYKNITHVAMVYEVGDDYITFIESFGASLAITRCGTSFSSGIDKTRAGFILNNIVMCARHPHAWNAPSNVPTNILQI